MYSYSNILVYFIFIYESKYALIFCMKYRASRFVQKMAQIFCKSLMYISSTFCTYPFFHIMNAACIIKDEYILAYIMQWLCVCFLKFSIHNCKWSCENESLNFFKTLFISVWQCVVSNLLLLPLLLALPIPSICSLLLSASPIHFISGFLSFIQHG